MPKEFGEGCHPKRMPLRQHGAHGEPLDEGRGESAQGAGFCGRPWGTTTVLCPTRVKGKGSAASCDAASLGRAGRRGGDLH